MMNALEHCIKFSEPKGTSDGQKGKEIENTRHRAQRLTVDLHTAKGLVMTVDSSIPMCVKPQMKQTTFKENPH